MASVQTKHVILLTGKEKDSRNCMITNPDWIKPEERYYFHQISHDCISRLAKLIIEFSNRETDSNAYLKASEQVLADEIRDPEFLSFAIENLDELSSYITCGYQSIRIHRNDADEIWFDVDGDTDF